MENMITFAAVEGWVHFSWDALLIFLLISAVAAAWVACRFFWKLRKDTRHLMALYQRLPERIGVLDIHEKILYLNAENKSDTWETSARYLRDIPHIDYEKLSPVVAQVFADGQRRTVEYAYQDAARLVTFALLPPEMYGHPAVVWVSHDNAELQRARAKANAYKEALYSERALYDTIINTMPIQVTVKDAGEEFRYLFANQTIADFIGVTPAAFTGKTHGDLFGASSGMHALAEDCEAISSSHVCEYWRDLCDSAGKIHHMRFLKKNHVDSAGRQLVLTLGVDVSELKDAKDRMESINRELSEAKQKAEELAEYFSQTLRSIGDGVMVTDHEGKVTMLNGIAEKLTGVDFAAAAGKPHEEIFRIFSYLDGSPVPSPVHRVLATGEMVALANHTDLISVDGRNRYHIADSAAPIRDHDGKVMGVILVFRDVTEAYNKRDQLQEARTSLEYSLELSNSASFRFNPKTGALSGSSLLAELWPVKDGVALEHTQFLHPDDLENYLTQLRRLLSGEISSLDMSYRSNYTGATRYFRVKGAVDSANPMEKCIVGVIQDVSESHRNMLRFKSMAEFWQLVIDSSPFMFFVKDAGNDFRYKMVNRAFCEFIGFKPEEIFGKTDAELFRMPEDADFFREKDRKIMACADGEEFEETPMDCHGIRHYLQTVKKPFIGADGEQMLLGAAHDVSELHHRIENESIINKALSQVLLERDFQKNINQVLEIFANHSNTDRLIFAVCAEDLSSCQIQDCWSRDGVLPAWDLATEQINWIFQNVKPQLAVNGIVNTSRKVPEGLEGVFSGFGCQAALIAPIFLSGKLWAVLTSGYHRNMRTFSSEDEQLMRAMANIIALAQIRERQNLALVRSDLEQQLILNNIKIPICLTDHKGHVVRANTAVCEMTGRSEAEILLSPYEEIFSGELLYGEHFPVQAALVTGQSAHGCFRYNNCELIIHAEPIINAAGQIVNVVESAIDVSEVNAFIANEKVVNFCLETFFAEENVQLALEKVLSAIGDHMKADRAFVMRFDVDRMTASSFVEYVASGAAPMFNCNDLPFNSDEIWIQKFMNHESIMHSDMAQPQAAEELGRWTPLLRENHTRSLYVAGIYLGGKLWGDIGFVYDREIYNFTERDRNFLKAAAHMIELLLLRRHSQEQIVDAMRQAQAANRAKSFFLASMSHEIRTPLNAVIGFSELLQDSVLSAETQKEYLKSISSAGNALLALINDVLDLSKLEAGQMHFNPVETDFEELVRDIGSIFRRQRMEKKLEACYHIEPMPLLLVDKLRLRQILFNLMGNALKFTDQGTLTLEAAFLQEDAETGSLQFTVRDTGIGIPLEDQERLFNPFVQSSTVRGTNTGNSGTGLGLAIIRRMLEKMDGEIRLESEVQRGSAFTVTIRNLRFIPREQSAAPTVDALSASTPKPRRILLVDDVEMNLKVLEAMLRKLHMEPFCASSGPCALELLGSVSPDLVLTDLWMPEMNGAILAGKLKKLSPELPVVALTADVESQSSFDLECFNAVLTKPVTLEKLRKLFFDLDRG